MSYQFRLRRNDIKSHRTFLSNSIAHQPKNPIGHQPKNPAVETAATQTKPASAG